MEKYCSSLLPALLFLAGASAPPPLRAQVVAPPIPAVPAMPQVAPVPMPPPALPPLTLPAAVTPPRLPPLTLPEAGGSGPAPINRCDPGGCFDSSGKRYDSGDSKLYLDRNGRACIRNGSWMQCP